MATVLPSPSAYRRSVGGSERIESSAEFVLMPVALVGQTPPEARSGVAIVSKDRSTETIRSVAVTIARTTVGSA